MVQSNFLKIIIVFFTGAVLLALTGNVRSQSCPIPCSQEQFPFDFCPNPNGPAICSSNPNADGTPATAWLPNSACVTSKMIGYATHQPLGPVPGPEPPDTCGADPFPGPLYPPDKETIWENSLLSTPQPWTAPFYASQENQDIWLDDITVYDAANKQWTLDSTNFFSGLTWELTDTTGMDANAAQTAVNYYDADYYDLFREYNVEYATYLSDSTAHANWVICDSAHTDWQDAWSQDQIVVVWDDDAAKTDANEALNEWYSACPGLTTHDCCLNVDLDNVAADFGSSGIGFTPFPAACPETSCASGTRDVHVNVSDAFLFNTYPTAPNPQPDPNYPIVICDRTWYTGHIHPIVNSGMEDYSFLQLCEHEMGHFLGFRHPDADGETNCVNNVTHCHSPSVMWQGQNGGPDDAMQVTCEDLNMFRKLYCPDQPCQDCSAGVSDATEPENLKAEIFPNPTTGTSLLQYQITNRSMVQVAIFDLLGNQVRTVTSGYEEPGMQSISLGTESLPAGHYICRISAGNNVTSMNLVIKK